jgi:hypothetical protein
MAFMKYLSAFSSKEDPESWLESYYAAAKCGAHHFVWWLKISIGWLN